MYARDRTSVRCHLRTSPIGDESRYKELDLGGVFWGSLVMKKAIAEFIGTFALVFIGCGTVVVASRRKKAQELGC